MKLLSLNFSLIFLFAASLSSCGRHTEKSATGKAAYQPLSEAEAKVYTTPTIYYIPQYDLTQQNCDETSKKKINNSSGAFLFSVCPAVFDGCLLQGTCAIQNGKDNVMINVAGGSGNNFNVVQNKICRFGLGPRKEICLDPFHSVAADLSLYHLGQVIFVPDLVGLELPDQTKHDGYFVVRDSGGSIKGFGRFDFFTGFSGNQRATNPFAQAGLAGKETHLHYYVLSEDEGAAILKSRNYPQLPVKN